MRKNTIIKIVFLLFAVTLAMFALAGCNKKNDNQQDLQPDQQVSEPMSEIDSFVLSVNTLKNSYDQNKVLKNQVEDAATQAMVMEGFISEMPELYEDAEYKTKIAEIYNAVNSIDILKEGLEKEADVDSSFNGLKQVVERLYAKFR